MITGSWVLGFFIAGLVLSVVAVFFTEATRGD